MKDSRQRILDKLAKTQGVKKASLGKRKLDLSKVDDLVSRLDVIQDDVNGAEQTIDEGYSYIKSAFETTRNAYGELMEIKSAYNNLEESIEALGIDLPQDVVDLIDVIYDKEQELNRLLSNFEDYGLYT